MFLVGGFKMLKTIHGDFSLLLWKQNRNNTNILQPIGDTTYDAFIKHLIRDFFEDLKKSFETGNKYSFCKEWQKVSEKHWKIMHNKCISFFKVETKDTIDKVVSKIKGNIGEIFAELFFTNCGGTKWISPNTYEPVDPTNERFIDAFAYDPLEKVKCGIQIKNYSGEIPSQVFWKAGVEDNLAFRELSSDLRDFYLKRKRQYIFSFTDEKFSPNMEAYKTYVEIIGPKIIDNELSSNEFRLDLLEKLLNEF